MSISSDCGARAEEADEERLRFLRSQKQRFGGLGGQAGNAERRRPASRRAGAGPAGRPHPGCPDRLPGHRAGHAVARYDEALFPTFWVPFLLVVMGVTSLGLSWLYHRRRQRGRGRGRACALRGATFEASAGCAATRCRPRRAVRWAWFPASALTPDDWQPDVVAAATATVSVALVVALLYLLGGSVIGLKRIGGQLSSTEPIPGRSRLRERIVALGSGRHDGVRHRPWRSPKLAGSVLFFFLSLAGLLVALVATFQLGLSAGYRPPGGPRVKRSLVSGSWPAWSARSGWAFVSMGCGRAAEPPLRAATPGRTLVVWVWTWDASVSSRARCWPGNACRTTTGSPCTSRTTWRGSVTLAHTVRTCLNGDKVFFNVNRHLNLTNGVLIRRALRLRPAASAAGYFALGKAQLWRLHADRFRCLSFASSKTTGISASSTVLPRHRPAPARAIVMRHHSSICSISFHSRIRLG